MRVKLRMAIANLHPERPMSKIPRLTAASFPKLKDLQYFLFDCDGVLWDGLKPFDGAKEVVNFLQNKGKKVFLVTNNSTKSRSQYVAKCAKLGMNVAKEQVVCSAFVAAQFIKRQKPSSKLFVIGCDGMALELTEAGLPHIMGSEVTCKLTNDVTHVEDVALDPEVSDVLVGFQPEFNYAQLLLAANYLQRGGCFFASDAEASLPSSCPNILLPGTGSIVRSVEVASGRAPVVMGKPHGPMMEVLTAELGVEPGRSLMVGDRLDTDIQFGRAHGVSTAAVLTGVTSSEQLQGELREELRPDFWMNSVQDLLTALKEVL